MLAHYDKNSYRAVLKGIRCLIMSKPKKVVLAYSGGLDTSIILKWLQSEYGCEVVTFTADLGQGEELEPARKKAELLGIKPQNIFIEDVREEFVKDFVFPMFRANAVYEGQYLLGTSIARPLISKRLVEIAAETGADAIAHGATGKGNDQVRFCLLYTSDAADEMRGCLVGSEMCIRDRAIDIQEISGDCCRNWCRCNRTRRNRKRQ